MRRKSKRRLDYVEIVPLLAAIAALLAAIASLIQAIRPLLG
jgi:hypothetical protein